MDAGKLGGGTYPTGGLTSEATLSGWASTRNSCASIATLSDVDCSSLFPSPSSSQSPDRERDIQNRTATPSQASPSQLRVDEIVRRFRSQQGENPPGAVQLPLAGQPPPGPETIPLPPFERPPAGPPVVPMLPRPEVIPRPPFKKSPVVQRLS